MRGANQVRAISVAYRAVRTDHRTDLTTIGLRQRAERRPIHTSSLTYRDRWQWVRVGRDASTGENGPLEAVSAHRGG